ncbi:unnamed protein product [Rotaria socialis]|uniref:ADP ribosyltransferase domain-containing protein n=1 Tax=Rotaria socialis TaxID=392032 RepID=A0A820S7H8_9BILA|nr:unnamed protein product [Rotaria socialis]
MATADDGRNSPREIQHKKDLPPLHSRPTSSQIGNNSLKAKQTFLEYKSENKKIEDQSQLKTMPTTNRDERRKSKMNFDYLARKGDDPTEMPAQTNENYDMEHQDNSLPLKIFDGTKKAISDVSEQSRSYFWMRRIKEIFLQMGTTNEPFVDFDMSIARSDMLTTCDVYIRNDFSKLKKKGNSSSEDLDERGLIQKIEDSLKQLRNTEVLLADKNSKDGVVANLRASTAQLMSNIRLLEHSVSDVEGHLKKSIQSKDTIDGIRKALRALPKESKSQLKIRQEWDMKKLYSEVFKTSYTRNDLRTSAQKAELKPVKKGNDEPNFRNAIWWYSCNEASIYYQINSILKLENFELLMAYRYYISDLCKMIEYIYNNEQSQSSRVNTYYRAASISLERLEQMKKSLEEKKKGQVISMGGFASTTTNLDIAKRYARTQSLSSGNVRVLFQIKVEPNKPCAAHAYIEQISFHPEEEEMLFSMGSTFSVDKIEDPGFPDSDHQKDKVKSANPGKEEVNYYTIHTTACDVDKALVDDIRAKVQECSASQLSVLLARYMLELGEYRAARKYLTELCNESTGILKDDFALPSIYNCLGMTFFRQNLHADAIEYYEKALDCQARIGYSNNNALAEIHNNIGLSYIGLKLMDEAQAMFEEAERIQLRAPITTRAHLASIYANIAYVHYAKTGAERNLEESRNYFEKALRIYQKTTSKITHDAIERALLKAECYSNYGHLLSVLKPDNAQERYNEALKIYKSILPEEDPKLMRAYMNIMMEHAHHQSYEKVIELYEDTLVNALINKQAGNVFALDKVVTLDDLIVLIQIVGACYIQHEQQFFKAMCTWTRAYELERKAKLVQLLFPFEVSMSQWSRKLIDTAYNKAYAFFMSDQVQMPKNDEELREPARAVSGRAKSAKKTEQKWPTIQFSRGFMCYKRYLCKDAIKYLKETMKENDNFHANLLLAEMFQATHDFKQAEETYTNSLKKIQAMKDQALFIEVSIAKIHCFEDDTKAIEDLKQLETILNVNDNDTTRISLKAIVYDMITDYYLKQSKYIAVITYANKNSIPLKMRSLSQYHPSLAKNHVLVAQAYIGRELYSDAIKYFENTVEIQRLNLASDHLEIKLVYYQMGDVHCMMNQLDQAHEKYEFAENDISDDNDEDDTDTDTGYDQRRLLARVSMNQHLATVYARRSGLETAEADARLADMTAAIEKYSESIDILKDLYPFDTSMQPLDILTLVKRLKQLAFCHEHLADAMALDGSDETESTYNEALAIQAKLFQYADTNRGEILRKIGRYYEQNQSDQETAISYYQDAVNESLESAAAITTYYTLGRLTVEWKEDSEAASTYYNEAYKLIDEDNTILKAIMHQKCPTIQDSSHAEGDDKVAQESSENKDGEDTTENAENTLESSERLNDDTVYKNAEAYQRLDDSQSLIAYCQSFIVENSESDTTFDFEMPDYDEIESDQPIFIKILAEILFACVEQLRPYEIIDHEKVIPRKLADAYLHWAQALKTSGEYKEAVERYFKSFMLYQKCVEATPTNSKLIEFVEKLVKNEFLDPMTLVSEYVLISPLEGTRLWLQVAAAYRHEEYNGEDSSSPVDNAIEACSKALENASKLTPTLKSACHYAMLRIYRDLRYADNDGKVFIEKIAKDGDYKTRQNHITVFDQRLLSQWVRDFIDEYNERCEDGEISSKLADKFFLPSLEDAMNEKQSSLQYLGDTLTVMNDYQGAVAYWKWMISECESFYSKTIKFIIYDEEKTIGQVFNEIQKLEGHAHEYMQRLVTSHVQLARYYIEAGERLNVPTTDTVDYFENATSQCQMAIKLRPQISRDWKPENVELQRLLKETEKKLTEAKTKAEEEEENEDDEDDGGDDDDEDDGDDDEDEDNDNNED